VVSESLPSVIIATELTGQGHLGENGDIFCLDLGEVKLFQLLTQFFQIFILLLLALFNVDVNPLDVID